MQKVDTMTYRIFHNKVGEVANGDARKTLLPVCSRKIVNCYLDNLFLYRVNKSKMYMFICELWWLQLSFAPCFQALC